MELVARMKAHSVLVSVSQTPPNMALQRTSKTVTLLARASKSPVSLAAELGC